MGILIAWIVSPKLELKFRKKTDKKKRIKNENIRSNLNNVNQESSWCLYQKSKNENNTL